MKEKSIKINAILNIIRVMMQILFPIITFPYVSRILGADNIGKVQFGNSIISYFSLIASLGITSYAIREGAAIRNKKEKFYEFSNQVFTINIITTAISYLLLILILFLPTKLLEYKQLILIQSISMLFTTLGVEWIYSIYEDYKYITLRSIVTQIISLLLLFIFVKNESDYYIYAIITVLASAGTNIFNFFHVKKYCKIKLTTKMNIKKHIIPMLILFANTISTTIYVNSDVTFLGFLASDYNVGLYSVSVKIYSIVKQLINAITMVSLPRVVELITKKQNVEYKKLLEKIINTVTILIIPIAIGICILSNEIIIIIAGDEYIQASNSLRILSITLIFAVIGAIFANLILIPSKKEKEFLKCTVLAAITNLILNFIFIPYFKQDGAAFTTLISEFLVCILLMRYSKKEYEISKNIIKNLKQIFIAIIPIILMSFLKHYIDNIMLRIIIITIVSSIIYFLILIIFKNETVNIVINELKVKIKKNNNN